MVNKTVTLESIKWCIQWCDVSIKNLNSHLSSSEEEVRKFLNKCLEIKAFCANNQIPIFDKDKSLLIVDGPLKKLYEESKEFAAKINIDFESISAAFLLEHCLRQSF